MLHQDHTRCRDKRHVLTKVTKTSYSLVSTALHIHSPACLIIAVLPMSLILISDGIGAEEPVHILAYYGSLGPAKPQELDRFLGSIRDGRYTRAKGMLLKLRSLDMPMELEDVCTIAGDGVAPGRLHVARAMVEAGYVENIRQAFSRYLYDGGPAYAT